MMKIAVVGLLASAGAVAEDTLPTGYTMSFYADYAQGSAIEEGAYDVVIDKLTRKDTRGAKRVTSQVNLCVAYTKAKQIDKATEACDAAVTIAEQTQLFDKLVADDKKIRQVTADAEREWAGRERVCPKCDVSFRSVGDRGQCPACYHTFFASHPDGDPNWWRNVG